MNGIKQAPYLSDHARIGLVAPSFGCSSEPYKTCLKESIKYLRELGYIVHKGKYIFKNEGQAASATGKDRAEEFMDAYQGSSNLILSVAGGELMCDILPYLDFQKIKNLPPKWFMGFSDNTNLTFTLTTLSGVRTIYGPTAPSFYKLRMKYAPQDALNMMKGQKTFKGYPKWELTPFKDEKQVLTKLNLTEKKIIKPVNCQGPFKGTLLGGCLDILQMLCGTKYDRVKEFEKEHPEGLIWYLEACDLNPLSIHRALFQLREAGWFNNAKGFLFGRHLCNDAVIFGVDKYKAELGIVGNMNVPVLMDIDLGHLSPSMPIMNGGEAQVKLKDGNIFITYLN